ncbi:MAG: DUF5018 domain-containing protein [Bacteroidales bacterium]|nr:DUF5018 domain-containing protein [Bacteroidales bacterium]
MKRFKSGILILFLFCISVNVNAQNLVQNPGFEAITDWDSLWVLSIINPSTPTAIATGITTDSHEGIRSVELSNTVFNKWSYFSTDSVNAPLSFLANKSYQVTGWIRSVEQGKRASLSILWNGSQNELMFYTGNPDPVTDPDWFMVRDTITPVANYPDGYLKLGFRAGKDGLAATGRILYDDFSVVRIPDNTETEIISFSIPVQTGPAIIDNVAKTITIEVPGSTDVTALVPGLIDLSRGATVIPASGVTVDFTDPVTYTVTAQNEITKQDWIVNIVFPPSSETDITAFSLNEQAGPATIDALMQTVAIEVLKETDLNTLIPTIEVSSGASIDPASGVSVDFSAPANYLVTAEDGVTTQNWVVTVSVDPAVSLGDEQEANMFRVYPNPAHDVLFVELAVKADLFIKDVLGRLIYTGIGVSGITRISLSDIEGGLYFAEVQFGYTRIVTKVLVE